MKYAHIPIVFCVSMFALAAFGQGIVQHYNHSVSLREFHQDGRGGWSFVPKELPLPTYPKKCLWVSLNGEVSARFTVGRDGSVISIEITKATNEEFARETKAAIERWRFECVRPSQEIENAKMFCRITFEMIDD